MVPRDSSAGGERRTFARPGVPSTMDLTDRPRRLRADGVRGMVSETSLAASDLIAPVFVDATAEKRRPIESMPGHERVPVEEAVPRTEEIREADGYEGANRYRARFLRAKRFDEDGHLSGTPAHPEDHEADAEHDDGH